MSEQPDPRPEDVSASEPAAETTDSSAAETRSGRVVGFLRSWTFWMRLGVGMLMLGTGVLIGLGIAWFVDEDSSSRHDGSGRGDVVTFEVDPSVEWFGEGRLSRDGKRFRFIPIPDQAPGWDKDGRGWKGEEWKEKEWIGKEWSEEERLPKGEFGDRDGIYIPYELLEEAIERIAQRVERLIERVEGYLEEGRFPPGMTWPDRFDRGKGDWGFGKDSPGGRDYFQDEPEQKDQDEYPADDEDEESWGGTGESPFDGFGFPFGELFSPFAFLEDCEVDFEILPDVLENLPDLDEEGFASQDDENAESMEDFFEQIEELLAEICETPADE